MGIGIPLPNLESLPERIREGVQAFPLNVFHMMANAPASFTSLCDLARSILFESEFDARKREIAVLRVAHVTRALYEWTHHVAVAKSVGVTESEIEAIKAEDPVSSLGDESNLLCRVADEISREVRLSDGALEAILDLYGARGATELILCVSYFNFLSRFLESTRVEIEGTNAFGRIHRS